MDLISKTLISLIGILGLLFFLLKTITTRNERAKRLAEQVFVDQNKAKPGKKTKNAIISALNNLSKAFYKLFFCLNRITKLIKPDKAKKIEIKLELIGNPFNWTPIEFVKLQFFSGFLFFLLILIIAIGNQVTLYYFFSIILGIVGFFYPQLYVDGMLQQRRQKITQSLPDAMDFIALCLAAGMNFQLAVDEYIKRNHNVLADEFSLFHNEVQVGISRIEAFQHMLDRNDAPGLRSFLSSVIQSERLGTPLRPVISNQAVELRGKRKQMIEKAIQSAPVKMIFPLILFILPAMMVIIFGSFLLKPEEQVQKNFAITTERTFFLRVTPGVRVFVNRNEFPIHHFTRDIYIANPKTSAVGVKIYAEKDVLRTKEEEDYLIRFFKKNKNIQEAWFVMIPLPEDAKVFLYIEILAPNKKTTLKSFYSFRYARFELYQFQEDLTKTEDKQIVIHGKVSSSVGITATLNGIPLEFHPRRENDLAFTTKSAFLKTGFNSLVFQLTDKEGYTKTIKKTIEYTGVQVDASFVEENETINDKVTLTGNATPLSNVYIAIPEKKKRKVVAYFKVSEMGKFSIDVPLETGQNIFYIYCVKDKKESPVIVRKMFRKLSE